MTDLFGHQGEQLRRRIAPLADRLRPRTLDEFVGQERILGPGRLLRRAILADRVGNLILHGPPGTGKTTLARIIAGSTRAHFTSLNAVLAGVKDLRTEVDQARQRLEQHGLRSLLFIDEVHRFNTAQQDALLPWVENGTLTLIGATTENPYFEVNKALVSRARLFRLQPLEAEALQRLLDQALADAERGYGDRQVHLSQVARDHLVQVAGGDARSLLNALELAVETTPPDGDGAIQIDLAIAEESIQQRAVLYDKQGDAHFDTISAFIKSLRGSDADAALFWLARMLEAGEDPRFLLRRMLIAAGEDVGLADPQAMVVVAACASCFDRVGLPEGLYALAQAALYLAGTEKSNSTMGIFSALEAVRRTNKQAVPSHLRDAHRDGKAFGDGVGYRYPHAYADHWVAQQYLPTDLQGELFWQPGRLGWEGERRQRLQERRAAQLAAVDEMAGDNSDLLSSSPQDPQLERWLRRQCATEGERLDRLRQQLWRGARIGGLDRVLVLESRSLLWSLDPLLQASEGEVVMTLAADADQQRLEAQVQLLDELRRPRLLPATLKNPSRLQELAQEGMAFEWFVARQPLAGQPWARRRAWLAQIHGLAAPRAEFRLLLSQPLLGPLGCLQHGWAASAGQPPRGASPPAEAVPPPSADLLAAVLPLEQRWLEEQARDHHQWSLDLEAMGWSVQARSWEEQLNWRIEPPLLRRWFAPGASYRIHLEEHLEATAMAALETLFRSAPGPPGPQRLRHTLVIAHGGPAARPNNGKPA
ncbi:MAG: AAA family ATPase [Cyanobacteria bacterium]|nr:AAA family ATPase [Cyanobacteriota bacterium]